MGLQSRPPCRSPVRGIATGLRLSNGETDADAGERQATAAGYGISTALITCTIPLDAEMSVAAMPAAVSVARVSVAPFSI
jgi:hypothetical protein